MSQESEQTADLSDSSRNFTLNCLSSIQLCDILSKTDFRSIYHFNLSISVFLSPVFLTIQLTLSLSRDLHASASKVRLLSMTLSNTTEPGEVTVATLMESPGEALLWLKVTPT